VVSAARQVSAILPVFQWLSDLTAVSPRERQSNQVLKEKLAASVQQLSNKYMRTGMDSSAGKLCSCALCRLPKLKEGWLRNAPEALPCFRSNVRRGRLAGRHRRALYLTIGAPTQANPIETGVRRSAGGQTRAHVRSRASGQRGRTRDEGRAHRGVRSHLALAAGLSWQSAHHEVGKNPPGYKTGCTDCPRAREVRPRLGPWPRHPIAERQS
jgi:hypothetical protein